MMRTTAALTAAIALSSAVLTAQEPKPVPKDSLRGTVPGCAKGAVFTAAAREQDQVARLDVPEGMHLRMNGPKALMADIKAHEGSMIEITGLMKKSQYNGTGVSVGGGVRISPGTSPASGRAPMVGGTSYIDVESWRPIEGSCPR